MVDPIAGKPTASDAATRVAAARPVAPVAPPPAATAPRTPPTLADLAQTTGVARAMAATAPVDADRVATIKKAIADGRFPILPATIADRLIALKLQWNPSDPRQHD